MVHLFTDLACHFYAFALLAPMYPQKQFELFLIYNFIAFVLQCPIGYLMDMADQRLFKGLGFGIGTTMLYLGYGFGFLLGVPMPGLIFCAFGNAFMHVVGSRMVLERSRRGIVGGGVFVAFGALGVGMGDYYGLKRPEIAGTMAILICIALLPMLVYAVMEIKRANSSKEGLKVIDTRVTISPKSVICLGMCLFVVGARSFTGFFLTDSFQEFISSETAASHGLFASMFPGIICFLGKAFGGILVVSFLMLFKVKSLRKMNYIYGISALLAGTVLSYALGHIPVCSVLGSFLLNSVMPVTLYEIFCILPKNPGFSLGLTTLMLFIGMLPTLVFTPTPETASLLLIILNMSACICLIVGLKCYSEKENLVNKDV